MATLNKPSIGRLIVIIVLTIFIVFVLFKTFVNINDFINVFKKAEFSLILIAIVIGLSGPLLSVLRWRFILLISGHKVPIKRTINIIMSVWPLSILPGRLGDFARSYPLRKEVSAAVSAGATLFEKIIDIIVLLIFSGVGFLFIGKTAFSVILLAVAAAVLPALFLISPLIINYLPKFVSLKLSLILTVFKFKTLKNRYFFLAVLSSAANWSASVLETWILFLAFGAALPIVLVISYFPLAIFIGLLPISIAGIGTRDSALIAFFINKATPAQSLAAGIGYSFIGYFLFAIVGIPFLIKEFGIKSSAGN